MRRLLSEIGTLITVGVVAAGLLAMSAPASAQFLDFGFGRPPPRPQQGQPPGRGGGLFSPFQQMFPGGPAPPPQRAVDYSHPPSPEKRETPAERNVLVLGDAMADWLAYGLEDAFAEQEPDLGVIRRSKTVSGLIRYQPKGDPADWVAAAKAIVATEKPDAIVVMLGLNDRMPIREVADKGDKKDTRGKDGKPAETADSKPSESKSSETEQTPDDADSETPSILAPEKTTHSASGVTDFREDRWVELYVKKIEDMIAVLKAKGVPVVWVGLPAVRGPKATSDMLFLDALYREAADKTGITYVDVWDGFVDDAGRFMPQGPDFEGQIRRLRSADGVFFTKAGARKLAHYVEREVSRLLAARSAPLTLPNEPGIPDVSARPGGPAPRPLAGPIVPLVASSVGTDELLGGPGTRPASVDPLAVRTLVKGEPLAPPAGRADDYTWPRRDVGRLDLAKETPVAEPVRKDAKLESRSEPKAEAKSDSRTNTKTDAPVAAVTPDGTAPAAPAPGAKKRRPPSPANPPGLFGFETRPTPAPVPAPAKPRPHDGVPRPPANVGRAASAPDGELFTR